MNRCRFCEAGWSAASENRRENPSHVPSGDFRELQLTHIHALSIGSQGCLAELVVFSHGRSAVLCMEPSENIQNSPKEQE